MTSNQKQLNRILHSVGLKNNLSDKAVEEIISSQFKFIHEKIREMSFSEMSAEDIEQLKTSFMLKYIGKIYTDPDIIQKIHNRKSFLKKLKEEYESNNGHESDGIN